VYFGVKFVPKRMKNCVMDINTNHGRLHRMFWIPSAVADIADHFAAVIALEYRWVAHNVTVKLPGTVGNEKDKSLLSHGSIVLKDGIVENPDGHDIVEGIDSQANVDDS
jgi:hypothetical protein